MIDTTEGPLVKKSIQVAWPVVLQAILVNFYAFNDYFFVARLNDPNAIAALSACFALIIIQYVWVRIIPAGATTLIAQYTGAKNVERVTSIFRQAIGVSIVFSTVLGFVAFFAMDEIVALNNVTPEVGVHIADYMLVLMLGAPAFALMLVVVGAFRARGDTKMPLALEVVSLVVNTVLNYALVLGNLGAPELGVFGAAIATTISRVLPGLLGLILIFRGQLGFRPWGDLPSWWPKWPDLRRMTRIGFFDSMSGAVYGIAYLILNRMAGEIGPAAQGGLGAGLRGIEWLAFAFSDGFMTAAITIVGQNTGAGQKQRALKGAIINAGMSAVSCQIVALLFLFFPEELCGLVTTDPETLGHAVTYVYIIGWFMWAVGLEMAFYGAFVGVGKTHITFTLGFIANFGRIPLAAALLFGWDQIGLGTLWAAFGLGVAPPVTGQFEIFAWTIGITAVIKALFYVIYLGVKRDF